MDERGDGLFSALSASPATSDLLPLAPPWDTVLAPSLHTIKLSSLFHHSGGMPSFLKMEEWHLISGNTAAALYATVSTEPGIDPNSSSGSS